MKSLFILSLFFIIGTAQANVLVCKSEDFNPDKYDGQALKLTLGNANALVSVEKVEGSWFGDSGKVNDPKVLKKSEKATVYEVNFDNDEYNGRVIIPNTQKIRTVVYSFSYADDERDRRSTSVLVCE